MKIILFFWFKNKIQNNIFNKKKLQIDFKSETKFSPKFPEPETRGMKIAGELASLTVSKIQIASGQEEA